MAKGKWRVQRRGWLNGHPAFMTALKSFGSDRRAGVATIFAITALPLMASVGVAVDYSRAFSSKSAMQAALDSTALTLAKQVSTGTSSTPAQELFTAMLQNNLVKNVTVTSASSSAANGTTITLAATGTVDTSFMGILGLNSIDLKVAAASFTETGTSACILALSKTEDNAVSLGGSTSVSLNGCSLYSNSSSPTAVNIGGSATLSAQSVGAVGGVSISSPNVTLRDNNQTGLAPVRDPYADIQVPAFFGCTDNNLNVKTALTINPGVYCNGITVTAGAVLTLNPGVYYIDRGALAVQGGATVNGTGVTIIFTSSTGNNWGNLTLNGNASVNLTAATSGPTAGLVIFGDPKMPVGTSFKFNGGSSQTFTGGIYVPAGAISYSGGAGTSTSCTQIIGDTVVFTGNSAVAINCSSQKTRPFGPTTIRLIS